MGKGWAKGLTAATDPRIARAAAGHRGRTYSPRGRGSDLRKVDPRFLGERPAWSSEMAYIVGLTATDGCLITGRRQINFKSGDRELVALYLGLLHRSNEILSERTRTGGVAYKTQFGDAALYRWLEAIGLTPRKSLSLGALTVPEPYLIDLARGLFDGDGTIINHVYRADTKAPRPYLWEYLITRFYSASRAHLEWLQPRLGAALGIRGVIASFGQTSADNPMWALVFGKTESAKLLGSLYRDPSAPCLERKRAIWMDYVERHRIVPDVKC